MKSIIVLAVGLIIGIMAFAYNPQQPSTDYNNGGAYQAELDASIAWVAAQHGISVEQAKAEYSYFWQFKISYEPQSLIISFFGSRDTCQVNADNIQALQGQCYGN
jgi:hypothetical protein